MIEKEIIGRFYFKQTLNLNLIGEYSNNISLKNLSECANKTDKETEPFIGKYQTIWFEKEPISMDLIIDYKEKTNKRIFTLTWEDKLKKQIFNGEGFIVDKILIGDYRNFKLK